MTDYFVLYLDHVQLKVFPFDHDKRAQAFDRARDLADKYAATYGAHRITIESRYGAIEYKPQTKEAAQ